MNWHSPATLHHLLPTFLLVPRLQAFLLATHTQLFLAWGLSHVLSRALFVSELSKTDSFFSFMWHPAALYKIAAPFPPALPVPLTCFLHGMYHLTCIYWDLLDLSSLLSCDLTQGSYRGLTCGKKNPVQLLQRK